LQWIRNVLREIIGLFVDDGLFALAILIWIGLVWIIRSQAGAREASGGIILFGGLVIILLESVVRFARRAAK
jgi:hypothetical protein